MKRALVRALGVGVVGAVLLAIQVALDPRRALLAYMGAFAFAITTALGALLFVMITHTARASWYVVFRRLNEAMAGTIPLGLALFVPIALAHRALFPWAHPERFDEHVQRVYQHDQWWFRSGFFIVRAYVYLAVWVAVLFVLRTQSLRQDADGRLERTAVQRWVSSATTPVLAITLTLAAIDWLMSLVPAWTSTIVGLNVFAASFSGAVGLTCVLAHAAKRSGILPEDVGPSHFLALGRVLLVAVILWAYLAFCALLLIWIGDLPHEVQFYAQRVRGGWAVFSGLLLFGHFILPFLALLSRAAKQRSATLAAIGGWVLVFHAVDMYWFVVPSQGDQPSVLDLGAFMLVGALAFAVGLWLFFAARPIPINDPNLARSLDYASR
jgi:hypothetical protein